MSSIEPGWYRDPAEPETQRYWDGEQWIGKPLPADADAPDGPPEPEPEPPLAIPADPGQQGLPGRADPTWAPPPAGVTPVDRRPPQEMGQRGGPALPPGFPQPSSDMKKYTLASPGQRLSARLIDLVAVLLLNVVVNGYFIYRFFQEVTPAVEAAMREGGQLDPFTLSERANNLQLTIMFIALLLWFVYEVPMTTYTGQTLGKRMVGIKVVPLYGQPLKLGWVGLRWSFMALPFMFLACGIFLLLADALWCLRDRPYRQCLHDKSPGTTVVLVPATAGPAQNVKGDTDVSSPDSR
ncbi:RDD family protein [Phytomonospora sp. NPDC050363]|uniref:RDD family protein n=1 Tax=Phytomonospora sp. NPDC050363 TaxID=3155642 RepID=UPI003410A00C